MNTVRDLKKVHAQLRSCAKCSNVFGPAVHGPALDTKIMLVGQAPGIHEGSLGKPFAYTAGKTLFKWLGSATGCDEEEIRGLIYFSAVARCFPGKAASGAGDRVPSADEIKNCRPHLDAEGAAIKPKLVLAVGRLAITELLDVPTKGKPKPLSEFIGKKFTIEKWGTKINVIPLPHPSGVSRWPQTEPGKTLLKDALDLFAEEFKKLV